MTDLHRLSMTEHTGGQTPINPAMRVDVYSHHVAISQFNDRVKRSLMEYCRGLGHMGLQRVSAGKFRRVITSVFAASTYDRREFRIHINLYNNLTQYLLGNGYYSNQILVVEHPIYTPAHVEFGWNPEFVLRDYQNMIYNYLMEPGTTKLVNLATGKGKGVTVAKALQTYSTRVAMVMKGMYVDKWIPEIKSYLQLQKGDLLVARGYADLQTLIEQGQAGKLEAKIILITNRTLANYYQSYETARPGDFEYSCEPDSFWETLGVGVRVNDEVHQEFHGNFKQDLYTNIPRTIAMTATLESDDTFINRMYVVMFPPDQRPMQLDHDRYINILALQYVVRDLRRIRFVGANGMYSQVRYEQTILLYKDTKRNYLNMVCEIARDHFISIFEPGQRMLIFAGTVEMCTAIRDELQRREPHIKVGRYTQVDPMSTLKENDVVVSTLKSAGTALDIDGLRVCYMTDAIDSKQANIQAIGRLRHLKGWPDVTPTFIYSYAYNLERHVTYHQRRQEKLKQRIRGYKVMVTNHHI